MLNDVQLIGRLTREPEDKGDFALFGLATTGYANGEETTEFHDCLLAGKQVKSLMALAHQGDLIYFRGEKRTREKDGKRYVSIVGYNFRYLRPKAEQSLKHGTTQDIPEFI